MALGLALVFTATAWSQDSPMGHGKMGMGKMGMGKSSQMKSCMQMMGKMEMGQMETGEMETTNAGVDELVERMRAADGAEKMAAMEELLAALAAQQGETQKMMRSMPKMMCGGMMQMTMQ
jgi:hypothetical protein